MGYIGASIYCNIGASNALSKEGDFRDSRRDLGQLIVIWVIVIWVIPNVFFAGANLGGYLRVRYRLGGSYILLVAYTHYLRRILPSG